jgi:tetratricopeptide (TPR) repeat protein
VVTRRALPALERTLALAIAAVTSVVAPAAAGDPPPSVQKPSGAVPACRSLDLPSASAGDVLRFSSETTDHYLAGRYDDAITSGKAGLAAATMAVGPKHFATASAAHKLATVYALTANYACAEELYSQALEIRKVALGANDPDLATTRAALGSVFEKTARYAEAEQLYSEARVARKTLGAVSLELAASMSDDAGIAVVRGRYAEAELLYREVLAARRGELGETHVDVAATLAALAQVRRLRGDVVESYELYTQALGMLTAERGPDVVLRVEALLAFSRLLVELGSYGLAYEVATLAYSTAVQALGAKHPTSALIQDQQLVAKRAAGTTRDAGEDSKERDAILLRLRASLGADHPVLAAALAHRAASRADGRDLQGATEDLREAGATLQRALGPTHPEVAAITAQLAETYRTAGHVADAVTLYRVVLESRVEALGPDHPLVAATRHVLGELLWAQGDPVGATEQLEQSERVRESEIQRVLGSGLPLPLKRSFLQTKRRELDAVVTLAVLPDTPSVVRQRLWQLAATKLGRRKARMLEAEAWATARASSEQPRFEDRSTTGVTLADWVVYSPISLSGEDRRSPRRYALAITTREKVQWLDVAEVADIDRRVVAFITAIMSRDEKQQTLGRDLDVRLLEPVRKALGGGCVDYLSPDGALQRLPFGALSMEDGRYVVEQCPTVYLPRARVAWESVVARSPSLLVRGACVTLRPSGTGVIPSNVCLEAETLAPYFATEISSVAEIGQIARPSIFHVTAWNVSVSPLPLYACVPVTGLPESYVACDSESTVTGEGEVALLDVRGTHLAVLSGYDAGRDLATEGDATRGLQRALLVAGAERVVASLWKPPEETRVDMMSAFYRGVFAGRGPGVALRDAALEVRAKGLAEPYFWAGYVTTGNKFGFRTEGPQSGGPPTAPLPAGCACDVGSPREEAGPALWATALGLLACTWRRRRRPGAG